MHKSYAVTIGRFQPFHLAHLEMIKFAFKNANKIIVILGSDSNIRTDKNPWTAVERQNMIESCLDENQLNNIYFFGIKDYVNDNNSWVNSINKSVYSIVDKNADIKLIGYEKDSSSFYLKLFPNWEFISSPTYKDCDATTIRSMLKEKNFEGVKKMVHPNVYKLLIEKI